MAKISGLLFLLKVGKLLFSALQLSVLLCLYFFLVGVVYVGDQFVN